jgi:hypothetical protein
VSDPDVPTTRPPDRPIEPGSHTIDADDSTMEEMRRYAEAAREHESSGTGSHTIDADDSTMEEMRRYAEAARRELPAPEARAVSLDDEPVFAVAEPEQHTWPRSPDTELIPVPPDLPGERWRPPPRTVMPSVPPSTEPTSAGLWKVIAIVLAVIIVVLAAFILLGDSSGGDQPDDSVVPGSIGATSITDPAESEGGDGDG